MKPRKPPTVVFDLDGTLVDTAPDLIRATDHALALIGLSAAPPELIRSTVSRGARAMIEEGLTHHGRTLPAAEIDALLDAFLIYYEDNIAVSSRPFPGAEACLAKLHGAGARIAICTNKREKLSRKLLGELGLTQYLHAIVGRDTLPIFKPDPGHLLGSVILADGDLSQAVMVGDSDIDVETAKRAGIPVIGVTFGYSPSPIVEFEPDAVIDHFDQLEACALQLAGLSVG